MQTPAPQYGTTPDRTMPKRDSALRIGIIFGIILFVTSIIIGLLFREIGLPVVGGITNLFAQIIILMIAGSTAARRFASGALSGLIAAAVSSILGLIAAAVGLGDTNALGALQQQTGATEGQAAAVLGVAAIIGLIFSALLGAFFGWLGGKLFGSGRADLTYRT